MPLTTRHWLAADAHCRALPGSTQDIKWEEHWVWSVGEKMYAIFGREPQHNDRLTLPVDPERFLEWTERPGIVPAPYLARHKWVQVGAEATLSQAQLNEMLSAAHARILAKLPARLRREIEASA